MMRKISISVVAICMASGAALAADLPSIKAAPVPPPNLTWNGFYAGLNAGGGFGGTSVSTFGVPYTTWAQANDQSHSAPPYFIPASLPWSNTLSGFALASSGNSGFAQSGVIGGLQVGYNYQVSNNIVLGVETDFQGASISGNKGIMGLGQDTLKTVMFANPAGYADTALSTNVSSSIDWLGTVRGRIGYLVSPALMLYGTGGFTYAGVSTNIQSYGLTDYKGRNPNTRAVEQAGFAMAAGAGSSSSVSLGWNAGGGFEYMVNQNWSVKAEAIYYSLGGINTASAVIGGPGANYQSLRYPGWGSANNTNVSYSGVIARAGVNYHFNLGNVAPVVAKF
jgi:outer membrane immunogenic protein